MEAKVDVPVSRNGSDEMFDKCCFPCSLNGVNKEATKFCQDCESHICIQCVKDHSRFRSLQLHHITDGPECSTGPELMIERCSIHHGRILDRFCKDHDEVCCDACVTIKHRSCENQFDLNEYAKNIDAEGYGNSNECLNKVISHIELEKDKRSFNLQTLDQEKTVILNDIDKFQDSTIMRIKELAEASREEVRVKHDKLINVVQSDVKELETVLSVSEESSNQLNTKGLNEAQRFVKIKNSERVVRDVSASVDKLSANWKPIALDYCFYHVPFRNVLELKSFGHFDESEDEPYIATKQGSVNVKTDKDVDCIITGICLLENDTVVVTDLKNKKIKILDKSCEIADCIILPGSPSSMCKIENLEVAVTLRTEKKVQFVSYGDTLSLGASFTTEQRCAGLYFDAKHDELYVSCDSWSGKSKICVYKRCGEVLRIFETDEDGKSMFWYPKNITMEPVTDMVYIVDERNGVIVLSRDGKKVWTFNDSKLRDLNGICQLPGNQMLVTGRSSNNVVQIGDKGKEIGELLKGLNSPYTVVCDKRESRIMIGCASNEISVYALHRK